MQSKKNTKNFTITKAKSRKIIRRNTKENRNGLAEKECDKNVMYIYDLLKPLRQVSEMNHLHAETWNGPSLAELPHLFPF